MSAVFWTVAIGAGVLLALGSGVNYVIALFS
jgi:hypothetical protein